MRELGKLFDLVLGTITVLMESGGEPRKGQLAVAYVLAVNRPKIFNHSISDVIYQPEQFSCWDTNSPTRMNIDQAPDALLADCLGVMLAAMYGLEPDPTNGAVFYLNKAAVMAAAGVLPNWWDIDGDFSSEVTIGKHSFRRKK